MPSKINVSLTFNDNKTSSIDKKTSNWGKKMSTRSHKYNQSSDRSKTKYYNILKQSELYYENKKINNPKIENFLTDNIEVRCKMFHIIEEYNSNNVFISKSIYRLKYIDSSKIGDLTDNSIVGILKYINSTESELNSSKTENPDIVINYFGKRNYDKANMEDLNSYNFSQAYIGTIIPGSSKVIHGYINTDEYMGEELL